MKGRFDGVKLLSFLLHAGSLLGLLFYSADGGDIFL
jgi:hypothetical protein